MTNDEQKMAIINQLGDDIVELNYKLVCLIREEYFEDAAVFRDEIIRRITVANDKLKEICGIDCYNQLLKQSDFVREQIENDFDEFTEKRM
jgi:hypothetical protein